MKGEVRARLKGRVLGPEWLKQIASLTYDDNPFTLDLELSVEDAKRLWPFEDSRNSLPLARCPP